MAKFIQIQVPTEHYTGSAREIDSYYIYYINVETIRFVTQNAQNPREHLCGSSSPRLISSSDLIPTETRHRFDACELTMLTLFKVPKLPPAPGENAVAFVGRAAEIGRVLW
jgi:hypothetical protein